MTRNYVIKAELPEVKKEDVRVTMEHGLLSVSGERNLRCAVAGKSLRR